MSEPILMKLGMYIRAPERISTAHFVNPSHQSVCLYVYPLLLLGMARWKRYRCNEYTCNNRRNICRVGFYAAYFISQESRRLILPMTSCFTSWHETIKKYPKFKPGRDILSSL
jgi:hypothetical protein